MSETIGQVTIPSNPADQKVLLDAMEEANIQFIKIADCKLQIAAIIDAMHEQFPDIPKKYIRKMMTLHYKANKDAIQAETDGLIALYETVVSVENK